MTAFEKRIARIRGRLDPDIPPVVLVYANGERHAMDAMEALHEIVRKPGEVIAAECEDGTPDSFFSAMLPYDVDFEDVIG